MRKTVVWILKRCIPVLLAFCMVFLLLACHKNEADQTAESVKPVATVNGEVITSDELEYFKGKLKAQVMNDYLEKYSVTYADGFWNSEFDGKTPEQALEEQALERCVTAKIQLVLMRDKGIYEDISYQALYDKAVAYNKENQTKENVVGIQTIQMSQFYSYYLDNGVLELQNRMAQAELKPSDSEMKERVNTLKKTGHGGQKQEELESIAAKQIILEKYDAYIRALRDKAEIMHK